jgi:hypothetical protein
LILVSLAISSCADSGEQPSASSILPPLESGPGDPPQNWDNPIEGTKIASVDESKQLLPFSVEEPHGLGTPTSIYVTPEEFPKPGREIAFVFDAPEYGHVVILEMQTDETIEGWHESVTNIVAGNDSPTRSGSAASVDVRDGLEALLTTSEDGVRNTLFWIERDVQFIVDGPALTADQVTAIANAL